MVAKMCNCCIFQTTWTCRSPQCFGREVKTLSYSPAFQLKEKPFCPKCHCGVVPHCYRCVPVQTAWDNFGQGLGRVRVTTSGFDARDFKGEEIEVPWDGATDCDASGPEGTEHILVRKRGEQGIGGDNEYAELTEATTSGVGEDW